MASLLVHHVSLFDGSGAPPLRNAALYAQGAHIRYAGPADGAPGAADEVIDGHGGTLLPGLIDAHAHISAAKGLSTLPGESDEECFARTAAVAREVLGKGVTTVRDVGSHRLVVLELARLVASGQRRGPEILAAGRFVAMAGTHFPGMAAEAASPEELLVLALAQLDAGARLVKLIASDPRNLTPDGGPATINRRTVAAVVRIAHERGARVTAHVTSRDALREAIAGGIDTVEHGLHLDDEAVTEMAARGIGLVPTLAAMEGLRNVPALPDAARRALGHNLDGLKHRLPAALAAGVTVATGTDLGHINRHGVVAAEVRSLTAAGLTPAQALVAATSGAAALLGLQDRGLLTPGQRADLLLVPGDPTEDPALLEQPRWVVQAGCIVATTP